MITNPANAAHPRKKNEMVGIHIEEKKRNFADD